MGGMIKSLSRLTFALSLVAFVGTLRQWLALGGNAPIASKSLGDDGTRATSPVGARSLGDASRASAAVDDGNRAPEKANGDAAPRQTVPSQGLRADASREAAAAPELPEAPRQSLRADVSKKPSANPLDLPAEHRIWIEVTQFAGDVETWIPSLAELLQLARAINGTIVEPCMTNGRLGSCSGGKKKIPARNIFDLSESTEFKDGRFPSMVSYNDYWRHRNSDKMVASSAKAQHKLCMALHFEKDHKTRCSAGFSSPESIDRRKFQRDMTNPHNSMALLQLEDYWGEHSINKIAKLFGIGKIQASFDGLSFHPDHVRKVEGILEKWNVSGDDFSAIHWSPEKKGANYMECAEAVSDAKAAVLDWRAANGDRKGADHPNHPFVLVTSLDADRDGEPFEALTFLTNEHDFRKLGAKVQDVGMQSVYDLILATKARIFATCARDGGFGCDPVARDLCEKCHRAGKLGKLALALRRDRSVARADDSWACWPDARTVRRCEGALDALDARFDEKRAARRYACARRRERIEKDESYNPSDKMAFDVFEPEAVCLTDERFGSAKRYEAFGDGPKFVCGVDVVARKSEREGGCLVYSIGSNNHVEFEQSVHTLMGCETHTFDPTLGAPFVGGEYAAFHPWGLGEEGETMSYTTYKDGRELSWVAKGLEGMMRELGHENRTIDVLKIDCQGCEYAALPPFFDLMAAGKVKVDQLQIELHYRDSWTQLNEFFEAADRAKMRIFHKERNQWGCDGYRCVEYAFASESFLREANRASICAQ